MIRLKNVFIALAALATLAACGGGKDEKPLDITGEWNLVSIQTKSATLGGQTVDVYILFASDRSFTMYQKIGAGRYYKYSGTYVLDGPHFPESIPTASCGDRPMKWNSPPPIHR